MKPTHSCIPGLRITAHISNIAARSSGPYSRTMFWKSRNDFQLDGAELLFLLMRIQILTPSSSSIQVAHPEASTCASVRKANIVSKYHRHACKMLAGIWRAGLVDGCPTFKQISQANRSSPSLICHQNKPRIKRRSLTRDRRWRTVQRTTREGPTH
jgi:hypothetical protein